jgi:hypothetical protein
MRKAVALVALLLLASVATLASGEVVRASVATSGHATVALAAHVADDVHAAVTLPERGADWATTQARGPHANDTLVAVLLAAALLVVAEAGRRAASTPSRDRAALGGPRPASRAPPAFV